MACIDADKYKMRPKQELIIVLDDLDFSWTENQINRAIFMWTCGWTLEEMAKELRPYDGIGNGVDEVALLIMHLARQKKIKQRKGGVFGYGK